MDKSERSLTQFTLSILEGFEMTEHRSAMDKPRLSFRAQGEISQFQLGEYPLTDM